MFWDLLKGIAYKPEPKLPEFKAFKKIPRITNTVCDITEKLDGTNGVIAIQDHKLVAVGSRSRWLSTKQDNQACTDYLGFYSWCLEPARKSWLERLDDGLYYGEYVGAKIGRTYGLDHRRLYLFRYDLKEFIENPGLGVYTIPYLGAVTLDTLESAIRALQTELSLKGSNVNGFDRVEGLVINLHDHRYKVIWDK